MIEIEIEAGRFPYMVLLEKYQKDTIKWIFNPWEGNVEKMKPHTRIGIVEINVISKDNESGISSIEKEKQRIETLFLMAGAKEVLFLRYDSHSKYCIIPIDDPKKLEQKFEVFAQGFFFGIGDQNAN